MNNYEIVFNGETYYKAGFATAHQACLQLLEDIADILEHYDNFSAFHVYNITLGFDEEDIPFGDIVTLKSLSNNFEEEI